MFRFTVRGTVWVLLYLAFVLAPLFAMLLGSMPPARSFPRGWRSTGST
jgi:hypothetical protein